MVFDEVVSQLPLNKQRGHLMCDEMQLKSGICWSTTSHKLMGFATEKSGLNLLDELRALEKISNNSGNVEAT